MALGDRGLCGRQPGEAAASGEKRGAMRVEAKRAPLCVGQLDAGAGEGNVTLPCLFCIVMVGSVDATKWRLALLGWG